MTYTMPFLPFTSSLFDALQFLQWYSQPYAIGSLLFHVLPASAATIRASRLTIFAWKRAHSTGHAGARPSQYVPATVPPPAAAVQSRLFVAARPPAAEGNLRVVAPGVSLPSPTHHTALLCASTHHAASQVQSVRLHKAAVR